MNVELCAGCNLLQIRLLRVRSEMRPGCVLSVVSAVGVTLESAFSVAYLQTTSFNRQLCAFSL